MKTQSHWSPAALLALLSFSAVTGAVPTGQKCCEALQQAGLGERLFRSDSSIYAATQSTYWSLDNSNLAPTCIVMPQTSEEVATAVKALTSSGPDGKRCNKGCKFAVRSAGHTTNPGANNIHQGVTIDLSSMNSTAYQADKSITSILPGARWGSVYTELAKSEVMVLGGRASTVGVGGLLLGGGNSFYSTERGFACDGVANMEVVLADGTIVNANASSEHSDLFRALKGGSNNFGVVTRYDLETFTAPANLWGGTIAFVPSAGTAILTALENFVKVLGDEGHRADSAIVFWADTRGPTSTLPQLIVTALHNVEGVVEAPAMAEFLSVPGNITFAMRTDTLVGFTTELEVPSGNFNSWYTLTFKNNAEVMQFAVDSYDAMLAEFEAEAPTLQFTSNCMFQGMSAEQFRQAARNGGNVLGLQDRTDNLVNFLGMMAFTDNSFEKLIDAKMSALTAKVKAFAASKGANDEYIFLNYADLSQNPLASYGADNLAFMKEVANKYDPAGVFQVNVPGGFKLAKV